MTINYVGCRAWRESPSRISYTEKEECRFLKIANYLRDLGYEIDTGVEGWAAIRVE